MRESTIEKEVCRYARDNNFLVFKFVSPGFRGVPDRLFISPRGQCFFMEFKQAGKTLRPEQERAKILIERHQVEVFVVDNVEFGKGVIDGLT